MFLLKNRKIALSTILAAGVCLLAIMYYAKLVPMLTTTPALIRDAGPQATTVAVPAHPSGPFVDSELPPGSQDIGVVPATRFSVQDVGVKRLTPSHYSVSSTRTTSTGGFYLLLRLEGVAGRTVQIDFEGSPFMDWGTVVPQYSYISDLDAQEGYVSSHAAEELTPAVASQAPSDGTMPVLPDTLAQQWHYVSEAWHESGRLCIRHKFDRHAAYITFRVPYTPGYNEAYISSLKASPHVERIEIGRSGQGQPLEILKIPAGPPEPERTKPCVLMYAREHPDEQDCSWIAQGAVQFLASDDPQARDLRKRFTFLVVPLFDPDGAADGIHENIIGGFAPARVTPETLAYAAWFKRWVDDGRRLDLVIPLHNPPPGSRFHLACPMMENDPTRLKQCEKAHAQVLSTLTESGFTVRNTPWDKGTLPERLSGWLADSYGPLVLPYEVNSLTPKRQLNLAELRQIGERLAVAAGRYLSSSSAVALMTQIDVLRTARKKAFSQLTEPPPADDAITAELRRRAASWLVKVPATSSTSQPSGRNRSAVTTSEGEQGTVGH